MRWLRRIALSIGVLTIVLLALAGHYYYRGFYRPSHNRQPTFAVPSLTSTEYERVTRKASALKPFLLQHKFNTGLCFLADMKMPSGRNRFFVYDLRKDSIILVGLVAHGSGNKDLCITPSFANVNGSGCTSLGKYRIGRPYQGQFGRAYKLYGMDSTNDQAFARNVVLHSFKSVPEGETFPYPICNSRGCPMVSPAFLQQLQPLIDQSKKPIMLCIFD